MFAFQDLHPQDTVDPFQDEFWICTLQKSCLQIACPATLFSVIRGMILSDPEVSTTRSVPVILLVSVQAFMRGGVGSYKTAVQRLVEIEGTFLGELHVDVDSGEVLLHVIVSLVLRTSRVPQLCSRGLGKAPAHTLSTNCGIETTWSQTVMFNDVLDMSVPYVRKSSFTNPCKISLKLVLLTQGRPE